MSTGRGAVCRSSFSPSCLSTASKIEIPSAPALCSWPRPVHLMSKSHAPLSPVESTTDLSVYPPPQWSGSSEKPPLVVLGKKNKICEVGPVESPWGASGFQHQPSP